MLTDEIADAIVPPELPRLTLSDEASQRLKSDGSGGEDDPLAKRILYWNDLIQQVLGDRRGDILGRFGFSNYGDQPASNFLSSGFVEIPGQLYANGLIHKSRKTTPYTFGASLIGLEGGEGYADTPQVMDLGYLDDRLKGFPLVIEYGSTQYFAAPNLANATATCWAVGNGSAGVLTAAHTFNWHNHHQNVWLHGRIMGQVQNMGPYPIDGAIVGISGGPSAQAIQLTPEPCPQPNEDFEFDGMMSQRVRGKVTTVSVLPGVIDPMEPARVRLDTGGQSGDSGALVRSLKTGMGLSIYSGVINTGAQIYNISQGLEQVANLFQVQLLE